jgi:hypothetical protein
VFDRDLAIKEIASGECPCSACKGLLTDPAKSRGGWAFCKTCACAWQISIRDGHRYAATVPLAIHRPVTIAKKLR